MNVSCVNTIYIALLGEGEHYTQIIHTGTIAVGLLHTPRGWGLLASSLGGEVLTRSLSSGGFASGLLGTGHGVGFVPHGVWALRWQELFALRILAGWILV